MPGVVIAGTHSGCGKTTATLGLLAALVRKGLRVQPFKTGPDFIDPGLHRVITGRPSRNLDIWMCGEEEVLSCYSRHVADADIAVVEGVMGMYDGDPGTARLAALLGLPVILVVDAYGMAESAGAVVKGFAEYEKGDSPHLPQEYEKGDSPHLPQTELGNRGLSPFTDEAKRSRRMGTVPGSAGIGTVPDSARIAGVIFNRVASENHFARLRESVRDIPVLGYLPRDVRFEIPHRHLGLMVAEESPLADDDINRLADAVTEHIDLDAILMINNGRAGASPAPTKECECVGAPLAGTLSRAGSDSPRPSPRIKIAVAYDKAFCFYYEDNFDALREAGADIVFFSPLSDTSLPAADGIYIGGGYPELYCGALSGNSLLRNALRAWCLEGRPLYAECGGMMFISRGIHDFEGRFFPMAGVLPFETRMKKGRAHLGYREIEFKEDCAIGRKGARCRGHEFHYSEIAEAPLSLPGNYIVKNREGAVRPDEGYVIQKTLASYIHIHFRNNSAPAENFVRFIKET